MILFQKGLCKDPRGDYLSLKLSNFYIFETSPTYLKQF